MQSKLGLDFKKVEQAKGLAKKIADEVQSFVESYTTVAVERTLCRLMGIDGVDANGVPLPNVVVDELKSKGVLSEGVLFYIANAMTATGLTPQQIAEKVADGRLDITRAAVTDKAELEKILQPVIDASISKIRARRERREHYLNTIGEGAKPYIYVIVATGNIYEDAVQAEAAARQGADIIAVIRTTGQSLLDYVPYGATTEGFGGTYATQENFKIRNGQGRRGARPLHKGLQLLLGSLYAGDCHHGGIRRSGRNAKRCSLRYPFQGYKHAEDIDRPVFLQNHQRLCRSYNKYG